MQLTLITINYNNVRATVELLRALEQQANKNFDVIVVDNDSWPADRALLGEYAPASKLNLDIIYSDTNRGFSGGNNLAIRKALTQGSEWVLLINNDTTVAPDFIEKLVAQLPDQPCVAQIPLNEGTKVAYGGIVQWLKPTLKHFYQPETANCKLQYIIGAGMLVHRSVFERIGLLDEAYFLYFEDADFSMRAKHAGIPIRFLHEPVIFHRESETTKTLGSPLLLRYHARNALRFNWRNGPWWVKLAVPLAALYGIIKTKSCAMRAGVFDFIFGRWGKIDTRITVGIECEQIEGRAWGIGHTVLKLLEQLAAKPELRSQYHFHLFFKSHVPDIPWLNDPIFTTHVVWQPCLPAGRRSPHKSFVFYLYVFLPIRLWFIHLDAMFYPNYMLPIIHPPWIPSLTLTTDDIWYEMRSPQQQPHHRLAYWVFGYWAVWRSTKLLAISESSKQELVRLFGIKPERIPVAHLAADAPISATGNSQLTTDNYILYVAQAFPRRHLRETVRAFEKISGRFPDLKLIAIGPDKYQPPLRIMNDHIIRKDYVPDDELTALYAHAKAFVYVSDREAFGLPPLEALSYGVSSVLADKPISRELFGEHAFYVAHPDSADEIARAITDALTNDAKRTVIRSAAPTILARFTWPHFASQWLEIIRNTLI